MNDIEIIKNKVSLYVKDELDDIVWHGDKFSVELGCDDVWEIEINRKYFISVGKLAEKEYEVFTLHYNCETKTTWEKWDNIPWNKDHLCQHKLFKSLKTAFNYALRAAVKGETPKDIATMY